VRSRADDAVQLYQKLQEDVARPIIYHMRLASCWSPRVKGVTIMVNGAFDGWRSRRQR
jgi:peptide/nickel transport system substrate-binding protein